MNPYRKVFAKHYCPVCDQKVRRVREPWGERMLREFLAYPVIGVLGLFIGGGLENAGWAEGRWAYIFGLLIALLIAFPLIDYFSRFSCERCNVEHPFSQLVSRGWFFA